MIVLGIETSCDETGVALYDSARPLGQGLLAQALHSQIAMHEVYGGVVPELASRDHIRRILPLTRKVLDDAGLAVSQLDAIAFTEGPGLAGALLVGASVASALAYAMGIATIGIHHLEGHLLSPLLSADPPEFPFVALLVSGGHTQLLRVDGVGRYELLGDTLDDAAGEAFDKSAKLLSLGYPGGPAIAALAESGRPDAIQLPRPMLRSNDLDFSFSGLKTAVLTKFRQRWPGGAGSDDQRVAHDTPEDRQFKADLAWAVQAAIVDVLVAKSLAALHQTGLTRLVVAGGVSANRRLRQGLSASGKAGAMPMQVYFPEPALCTDNGAMIAFAGALRLAAGGAASAAHSPPPLHFAVRPRWPLETLAAPD